MSRPLRLAYRTRQFWQALRARPDHADLVETGEVLNKRQQALFQSMPLAEQAHAVQVLHRVQMQGERHPDLLVAALLHDVGKARFRLALWERVLTVLTEAYLPHRVVRWRRGRPRGWKRAFVIGEQHPYWGAELAARAGASPLAVNLIWRHHEPPSRIPRSLEDRLLRALQAADDDS